VYPVHIAQRRISAAPGGLYRSVQQCLHDGRFSRISEEGRYCTYQTGYCTVTCNRDASFDIGLAQVGVE
jgi:hypothetical protein